MRCGCSSRQSRNLPAEFAEPLAQAAPRLGNLASRLLWFDAIGSTNDVAVSLAERDEPEGTVIIADEQLAGRGRLGRSWASPAGAGLYVSVVLRPSAPTPISDARCRRGAGAEDCRLPQVLSSI